MDLNHIGVTRDSGRGTGDDDDHVAFLVLIHSQQSLINGGHHVIGGLDRITQEGLCAPGQRQLRAHRRVRGEGKERQRGVQASHALRGVAGGGEGDDGLRIKALGNIARGVRDDATLSARHVRQRRNLAALLSVRHDAGHRADNILWVDADGGLTGEHNGISTIEHCVSHVGGLRASRAQVGDHGIEHLRCHDHRLGILTRDLDSALLEQRNLLQRYLDAEVTARNHDGIESQNDGFEGIDCLRLLELRDNRDAAAFLIHDFVDFVHVRRRTNEGQGNHVHAELQCEAKVSNVLLRQRRHRNVHAWEGHALVIGDRSALGDLTNNVIAVDFLADDGDLAVVDQQAVTRLRVLRQVLVGGGHAVVRAFYVFDGDADDFAVLPHLFTVDEATQTDLRSLEVRQDADCVAGLIGSLTDPAVVRLVVRMLAVGHVETRHVHACFNEAKDSFLACYSRTQRTNNFGSSIQHGVPYSHREFLTVPKLPRFAGLGHHE